MSAPTCYVIDAAQWDHFMVSLGWAFLLCFAAVVAASTDWHAWIGLWRRQLRRRRLRRIRAGRIAHG